jgi:acyl-CoA synthetase (AMP-forming)/AMP-acid ligase II
MRPHRIQVSTLGDLLLRAADRYPDHPAIIFPDARLTYAELRDRAYIRARSLLGMGLQRRDHIGILMPNCLEYVECLFGIQLMGGMAVPMNARYRARELTYVVENADLAAVLTSDLISEYANFADLLTAAFPSIAEAKDALALSVPEAPKLRSVVMLGSSGPPGIVSQQTFAALAQQVTEDAVEAHRVCAILHEPAIMMYTSGTTSNPKGCPLSHEVLVRSGTNANRERYFLADTDRFWAPLPMFHMASILPMIACMDAGAAMQSMTYVEAGAALEMMERDQTTVAFPSFPTVTNELINHPDFKTRDLSSIRRINNVAPPEVLRKFQEAFPQAVQTGAFGLTEVGGVIAFNHPDDSLESRLTTCGKPFPGVEVKVVDPETDAPCPAGQRGEMLVRGYAVFEGYYKAPEKNAEAFTDGWFRTGDLCSLDEEGRIQFHGRIKDTLKVGGENVAALEIESYLATHPAVKLAQVVGVPDERLQEVPAAFIELNPGTSASEAALIDFCKGNIASFKVPRYVRFVEEWPMSATKVQKFRLLEDFQP